MSSPSGVIHWYPSHMAVGLRKMRQRLQKVDLVLEVRDARIPVTSTNDLLSGLLPPGKERIVIFNKADLADQTCNSLLKREGVVLDKRSRKYDLIRRISAFFKPRSEGGKMMIVGIPNVGKSTILNRLRAVGCAEGGGKAVRVGNLPGVTRLVSGIVRILDEPRVYLYDTPGVLWPRIADRESALKLALTGAIPSTQFSEYDLAEYLLKLLLERDQSKCLEAFYKTRASDLSEFLDAAGRRLGLLQKGGEPNTLLAAQDFLARYREGKFGRFTLDEITNQTF